jgi:hypothetical protein
MSAAPVTSPAWPPAAERLHQAMQRGAVLFWAPNTGYRVTLPSGKVRRVRWFVASALRQAGIITTNDENWHHARRW